MKDVVVFFTAQKAIKTREENMYSYCNHCHLYKVALPFRNARTYMITWTVTPRNITAETTYAPMRSISFIVESCLNNLSASFFRRFSRSFLFYKYKTMWVLNKETGYKPVLSKISKAVFCILQLYSYIYCTFQVVWISELLKLFY